MSRTPLLTAIGLLALPKAVLLPARKVPAPSAAPPV